MTPMETVEAALDRAGCRRGRNGQWTCPSHEDRNPSLSVKEGLDGRVLLDCKAGCDTEKAVVPALGLEMADLFPPKPDQGTGDEWTPAGPAIATYVYTDAKGKTLFGVCRTADKQFRQWRPDPSRKHGRAWSLQGVKPVLYRLPKVLAAIDDGDPIYVAEGEKDVSALESKGVTATCNPMGAGKWRAVYSKTLAGATVVVIADNDVVGRKHARQVAASLTDAGCPVRLVRAATGKDAADHLAAGLDVDGFVDLEDEPEERVAAEPPPKALPVDQGAVVLKEVEACLLRFVVFGSDSQRVAVTLHVAHTWCFEAAETTGYLWVHSPEKQSGKTRLLEVLRQLDRSALMAADMTAAAVYRSIVDPAPAILFDEVQELLGRSADDDQRQLRGCLNSGYRLGGAARRCVGDGANQRVEDFPTYCPKVLAGTGTLPDMLADRSIPILLQRKIKSEQVERFRIRRVKPETEVLCRRLAGWAQAAIPALEQAEPELPEQLSDRQQDCWEALLAIADLAGGDWPQRARRAALELHGADMTRDPSTGTLLLTHIREAFIASTDDEGEVTWRERLATTGLLRTLVDRDDGPWAELWADKLAKDETRGPAAKLAGMLKPFGITPTQYKVPDEYNPALSAKVRGYLRSAFTPVWGRYLGTPQVNGQTGTVPPDGPVPSSQASDQQSTDVPSPNAPPGAERVEGHLFDHPEGDPRRYAR